MAHIQTIHLPHFPNTPIHLALFTRVKNASYLRSQLLSANPSFDYAFLDATMILSPLPLLLSAALTLSAHMSDSLKTRTPHSELVFRLHPNNNIGESYRKFGIADDSTELIAVKISLPPGDPHGHHAVTGDDVARHLGEVVDGESVVIEEHGANLGVWADVAKIRKVYKLNDGPRSKAGKKAAGVNGDGGNRNEVQELENAIMGIMTLKGS